MGADICAVDCVLHGAAVADDAASMWGTDCRSHGTRKILRVGFSSLKK